MVIGNTKKNKINLEDYDYKRDIENRIFMAHFSTLDVEVLDEILNSSLKVSLEELADYLDMQLSEIMPSIEKISKTGLFQIKGTQILVDKEMRKYYDFQIMKFDEDFKPGMEFFQGLLKKVPIHVLPSWYMIPRTSDNIFQSLVEKYLLYPKVYQRYLEELIFDDPIFDEIIKDIFNAPNRQIRSHDIREKYSLSREDFEEYMLHLEFNCVCCLRYQKIDDQWKEVVTPFYEWNQYLTYLEKTAPKPIEDYENITPPNEPGHAFIGDMTAIIKFIKSNSLPAIKKSSEYLLSEDAVKMLYTSCHFTGEYDLRHQKYLERIINRIMQLNMGTFKNDVIEATENSDTWLRMTNSQRSLYIIKHPGYDFINFDVPKELFTPRNHRHVERSLNNISNLGWVYFDDYMKTMTKGIGDTDPVMLKKRGRNWEYMIPKYSDEEKRYIEATIFEKLFEAGIVEVGVHKGKSCFKVVVRH